MKTTTTEILDYAIEKLNDGIGVNVYGCDLHNELFNTDYFIIGYYNAEQFLINCEHGIFGAINLIKDYEENNFGQVSTDLSNSEKVANMYAYIIGEEILNESKKLISKWNTMLSEEDLQEIKNELY